MDWRGAVGLGLVASFAALSSILFAAGFDAVRVLVVSALVLVPLTVTAGVFLLVWRYVWRVDR